MNTNANSGAPWYFWPVAVVILLWNAFGGYDYYMTQIASREYLGSMTEAYGLNLDDVIAYYDSFPMWMEAAWGTAIWTSFAGGVLLILRSGFASYAFIVSLVAMVAAMGWQLANPMPGVTDLAVGYIMTAVIFIVLLVEIWFARSMTKRGVLR